MLYVPPLSAILESTAGDAFCLIDVDGRATLVILLGTDAETHPVQQEDVQSIYEGSTTNSGLTVDDTVLMFMTPVHGPLHTEQPMVGPSTAGGAAVSWKTFHGPPSPSVRSTRSRMPWPLWTNGTSSRRQRGPKRRDGAGRMPAPRNRLTTLSTPRSIHCRPSNHDKTKIDSLNHFSGRAPGTTSVTPAAVGSVVHRTTATKHSHTSPLGPLLLLATSIRWLGDQRPSTDRRK